MKNGIPKVDHVVTLLAEYRLRQQAGQELAARLNAMCRALHIENNLRGSGPVRLLKEAIADYSITHRWPPKRKEEKKT